MSLETQIKERQRRWATGAGLNPDAAGYLTPELNLPWLSQRTRDEFAKADGNEFGNGSGRAKIAALHSSSALAVNFFDFWRGRDLRPLAAALELGEGIRDIAFEVKLPTGVGTRMPNIDVILEDASRSCLAIESKFAETFRGAQKAGIQDKYLAGNAKRWSDCGLAGAQSAAAVLYLATKFAYLDPAQLLKHMLGLGKSDREWSLLLLWYAPTSKVAEVMKAEVARFQGMLGSDSRRFSSLSYQQLWVTLLPHLTSEHDAYREYMTQRYFSAAVA